MCPFCGNVRHVPSAIDTRPMSVLQLTPAEYAEYKSHNASDTMYKQLALEKGPSPKLLRVVGFNEDTKTVFRACNPAGNDCIEVPWDMIDSVKWIAQRVEDKIRVSLHHWYLATADGVIFKTFGELAMSTEAFRVKGQVVLTLLMPTDLAEFGDAHLKQHTWKQTTLLPSASADALEKCVAAFHLLNPTPAAAWGTYFAQRKAAEQHVEEELAAYEGEDKPAVYEMIDAALDNVLVPTELEDHDNLDKMHDCILPLSAELHDDGWGNVASAEILSRIYSPTAPAAVDVYLEYHYRTRYESVEFYCNVYYRVHPTIADAKLTLGAPRAPRTMNGFRTLFEMGLADIPPGRRWRAVDERKFGMSAGQVASLHRVLFGEASSAAVNTAAAKGEGGDGAEEGPRPVADIIGKREMLMLLLASVGISFYAAENPKDKHDVDEYQNESGDLRWEGLEGSEKWLGRQIRSVVVSGGTADVIPDVGGEDDEDEWEDEDED
ncbi:hypothetical protein C8J57DRAFT_1719637 [Mycena rebaudengoi]|nr:hypothetical protein C8J57DRAFT_1719637 [Mycena rebaudengoi]